MLRKIVFEDEITLWWDWNEFENATHYCFYLEGRYHGESKKTHYSFLGLQAQTSYCICVEAFKSEELLARIEIRLQTAKAKKRLDVTQAPYFAKGDGKTLNTQILQKALDDCTENDVVYFPKGTYFTGALNVHSDTEIYLDENAVLQGTANEEDYLPKIKSRFEGIELLCYRSMLNLGELDHENYVYNCRNVIIRGKGAVLGGGRPLATAMRDAEKERLKDFLAKNQEYVKSCETVDTIPGRVRGRLVHMCNCENVVLSGLTLGYAPSWNIHFIYSKNVVTYGCNICSDAWTSADGKVQLQPVWNGDGWDPDSSEDCTVFDTVFDTYDDGIAIKSGKNPEGNCINRPTKNVRIFDCRGKHGVAVGSELSGGVENVFIWDCEYLHSPKSINLKTTAKRGGYIKNVMVKNCDLLCVSMVTSVGFNNDGEGADTLTKISDLRFENLRLKGNTRAWNGEKIPSVPIFIEGFDEKENPINNVTFQDVVVEKLPNNEGQRMIIKNAENVTTDILFE